MLGNSPYKKNEYGRCGTNLKQESSSTENSGKTCTGTGSSAGSAVMGEGNGGGGGCSGSRNGAGPGLGGAGGAWGRGTRGRGASADGSWNGCTRTSGCSRSSAAVSSSVFLPFDHISYIWDKTYQELQMVTVEDNRGRVTVYEPVRVTVPG